MRTEKGARKREGYDAGVGDGVGADVGLGVGFGAGDSGGTDMEEAKVPTTGRRTGNGVSTWSWGSLGQV